MWGKTLACPNSNQGRPEARLTELTAMAGEGHGDLVEDGFADHLRAAEVAPRLLGLARSEVARPGLAMLGLALGGQSKPLFRSFVCLLLWHFSSSMLAIVVSRWSLGGRFFVSESLAV